MKWIFSIFVLIFFVGCSSLVVKPENILAYNNGIAIIQDKKTQSKIQFEIAQEIIGGFDNIPLIIYITIENLSDSNILFSTDNVSMFLNGKSITPYSFNNFISSNINISQALYDYGIEVTTKNTNIIDPFFNPSSYYAYPIPIFLNGGFVMAYRYYDYSFARANIYSVQSTQYNARQFLIAHYLRKNTLKKNDVKGGFILIPRSNLKEGNMIVNVKVGKDIHTLKINLQKR